MVNEYYENIAVKLHINGKSYTVVGTYRPPSASLTQFNDLYFQNFDTLNDRENILVLGDFNVDLLSESLTQSEINFFDEFSTRHLIPLINIPTRVSPTSSSCIDHIYCNFLLSNKYGVISEIVADNFPIFCNIPLINAPTQQHTVKFRQTPSLNLDNFKNDLDETLKTFDMYGFLPVCDKFEVFDNILLRLYNKDCPISTKRLSTKRVTKPWMTSSLLQCVREKHRLYRLSLCSVRNIAVYKRYRNTLCNIISKAKSDYYE